MIRFIAGSTGTSFSFNIKPMIRIFMLSGMLLAGNMASACDVCGCASSSFSLGLLPSSNHHLLGLRTNIRAFRTTHPPLFGVQEPSSKELFTSTDLYGRWKISRRFQLLAVVPYVVNLQSAGERSLNIHGIGDVTALGNFVFVNNTDSLTRHFKQSGTFGLGVKAPTGRYDNTNINNRNMLPGTGTVDLVATLNYSVQKASWGYLSESSFTYKTANRYGYQFGHSLGTTHLAFYRWMLNENLRILPQLGANLNHNFRDRSHGKITDDSYNGGMILNAQATVSVLYKNWAFSASYFAPVYQHLANGYVDQLSGCRFSLNYFINKRQS